MKKKYILYIVGIISIITIFIFVNKNIAKTEMYVSDDFPDSYKPYIEELKRKYPNWEFKALYTNLDWKYVIDNENIFGKNLVPKSYSDSWKNTKPGEYNVEVDSGWVDSSRQAVEYAMDPRNFLNYVRVFQFEELSYNSKTNTKSSIEKILYGTEFYNRIVEYLNSSGENIVTDKEYSDLILSAAKISNVSGFHLASRIKQEVGPFLSHSSISGKVSGFEGLYNFYNIGATSSSEPMGAIKNGLRYAKDGKGASEETKKKYLIPWNTKERAITGGGIFIGSSYINLGQNTIYLQKFHVNDTEGGELFWHQYMTNVLAPYSESKLIYTGYNNSNLLNSSMSFIIPIYENMPELPALSPSINTSDYTEDNTKVFANVETSLNVRSGPGTIYEILTSLQSGEEMTRIAKGKQKGELWDRVKLQNGMVGFVFSNYLEEVPESNIEEIKLNIDRNIINKGEKVQLRVETKPDDVALNEIEFSSENSEIATISSDLYVLGLKSGKTKIYAKAKNGVEDSINIDVVTPLEDIILSSDEYTIQEEEKLKLEPIIFPDDADNKEIKYVSENSEIASIDNNGVITGNKIGSTNIILSGDNNITKKIKINVIKKLEDGEIVFSENLEIDGNIITGLANKNNTVTTILNQIQTNYNIEVYDKNNKKLNDNELIGTGTIIKILDGNNVVIQYEILLYGDVNSDGKINSIDLLVLQRHILEIEKLSNIFVKAGNVRKNHKNPSSVDCLLIQRHILGIQSLDQ